MKRVAASSARAFWAWPALFAAVWLESCGAMTIEPATPDEPAAVPPPAPRLRRRDAGFDAAAKGGDDDV
jgi:hypothetical protein